MATILIVEDEDSLREQLSHNLEAEGYETITASDGQMGLDTAREMQPDLIILDLMLPQLDGLSVCRMIRRDSQVPIIMLSARGMEMDKITGLETGADDYVVKPFGMGELLARVKANLRREASKVAARNPTVIESNELKLDMIARRVWLRDVELHLTQKEFGLLVELMRNKGVVLSRDLLLEQVWGHDYVGNSHTVDVHMRWLREKIEDNPSKPMRITTVRGVGYRFED